MKLKKLRNAEVFVEYIPKKDEYCVTEGILSGYIYRVHVLFEEDMDDMQCFEIWRKRKMIDIGTEISETLLMASPLMLEAEIIDADRLTEKKVDQIAREIIIDARDISDSNYINMWNEINSPYCGRAFFSGDKGLAIIIETEEWFRQNPDWEKKLCDSLPNLK